MFATRRTRVPVSAAAASSTTGKTTRLRAASGTAPKMVTTAEASHSSPQWYQVWGGKPESSENPEAGQVRLGSGRREIAAKDRVIRFIHVLDGLDPVPRARGHRRSVEQCDRDDEDARRGSSEPGTARAMGRAISFAVAPSSVCDPRDAPGRTRPATASPTAIAKPIATGVKELRPPDHIAAHQEASTRQPGRETDAQSLRRRVLHIRAARRVGRTRYRRPDRRRRREGLGRSPARPRHRKR